MDWDANLAAIIKHTDANLQQQFRQFDAEALVRPPLVATTAQDAGGGSGGFAQAFLRDTMATLRGPSTSAMPPPPPPPVASFAQHFREQQDRKRQEPLPRYENNRATTSDHGASDGEDAAYDQPQCIHHNTASTRASRRSRHSNNATGLGFQMYASPTYDVAQMMEQVRLSLKLEVDARAAIAERQLSALLQLCKASSEEIDRLRVEVCAADRQLHTLDQVQAKMRQELTTQKDIGFHLQSMCGKDESWRMQAENQLLEMRQLVAAIREQGNAIQMQVQEKLSRQELLVQFNAAIEPIKAQFQATLQHQAHQLAEITRTSSSSSLVLDALTQKLNRVQADEIVALRNDLQALKVHMSRMGAMESGRFTPDDDIDDEEEDSLQSRKPTRRATQRAREKEAAAAQERERLELEREQQQKQREQALKKELADVFIPQTMLSLLGNEVDKHVKAQLIETRDALAKDLGQLKHELHSLDLVVQGNRSACQQLSTSTVSTLETAAKQTEQQLRSEFLTRIRDFKEKQEQLSSQSSTQLMAQVEGLLAAVQAKHNDVIKVIEAEQKDRKTSNDALHEELRRARHAWEEQLHVMKCDQRTKVTTLSDEWNQRLRDMERKWNDTIESTSKQSALQAETNWSTAKSDVLARIDRIDVVAKATTEVVEKLEKTVAKVALETTALAAKLKACEVSDSDEESTRITRRGSMSTISTPNEAAHGQLAAIDSLLQKMMLQMQLQMQQQHQFAMSQSAATVVQPHVYTSPYWATVHPHANASAQQSVPSVASVPALTNTAKIDEKSVPPEETARTNLFNTPSVIAPAQATENANLSQAAEAPADPQIDEIISRAVAEEFVSSMKSQAPRQVSATVNDDSFGGKSIRTDSPPSLPSVPKSTESSNVPHTSATPLTQPFEAIDPASKVQQTLASTVKGATTEAEMAKQRIEARRKQDQEARQQVNGLAMEMPSPPTSPPLTRASSASSLLPHEYSKPIEATTAVPTLSRSHSVSNLTQPSVSTPPTQASPVVKPPTPQPQALPAKPTPSLPAAATRGTSGTNPVPPRPSSGIIESKTQAPTVISQMPPPPATDLTPPTSKPTAAPSVPTSAPPQQQITHVLCDQCRLPVRSDLLTEHMQRQCIKRTTACTKCLSKFPWHEVDAHQRDCQGVPATTSMPPPSRPTVMAPGISPSQETLPSDSTVDAASATPATPAQLKKCRHCAADVVSTDLFDHELKCDQMLKQCPHCLRRQKVLELQDHIENCDCRLVSCPNDCGGKFLQRGLDKHLTTRCPKRSSNGTATISSTASLATASNSSGPVTAPPPPPPAPRSVEVPSSTNARAKTDDTKLEKVECKFCDEEYLAREIDAHENSCDWKPKRCQHCNMVIISRDLTRHESSCKTSTKNCPHCNETMAQSALTAHTSRCSKRPIKCIRCCQLFPADSIVAHSSSCKFIPGAGGSLAPAVPATTSPSVNASTSTAKIPPPPPYPPTSTLVGAAITNRSGSTASTAVTPSMTTVSATATAPKPSASSADEMAADRIARRNLALSQLTNQPMASTTSGQSTTAMSAAGRPPTSARPEVDDDLDHGTDGDEEDEEDGEEEDDDEEEEDDDEDQLTLAQVVAEWSVENVCLWLHEDVGVPEIVPRFQQRRCNGEMLLELTESDLINDYGIRNRIHRERILSAIEAIKTSDDFSDDEEEEEEDGEEDMVNAARMQPPQQRASVSRLTLSDVSSPRDLLRRNSLPSPPQSPARVAGAPLTGSSALPSSSAMLRRINSALNVEFPSTTPRQSK